MPNSSQTDSTQPLAGSPTLTSFAQAEVLLQRLANHKQAWAATPIAQRLEYLQHCVVGVAQVAEAWAEAACCAKGIDPTSSLAGEEWLIGAAATLTNLQQLKRALAATGQPPPAKLMTRQEQTIAQVFPANWMERLLFPGFTGEVWLQPGQPPTQGKIYREPAATGTLALVLGAGNVSSIAPMDLLYKLFAENAVVLLKLNPVNDYLGQFLETAFASLQAAGYLEFAYGGAELGSYLCQHPQVDTIHITGSQQTHDAIVWGSAAAPVERQQTQPPLNAKPITSELGCVTPVLVVPGNWSPADLAFQARQVAGMVVHNASFNCAAAQVLVLAQGWSQRQMFLNQVRQELAKTPDRRAYYPGAQQRYAEFLRHYPQAEAISSGTGEIPWTLIPNVPAQAGEYALTQEAFCGVLAEVSLETATAADFLDRAVTFANDAVWGNLSCTLLIDPVTARQQRKKLETAVARLHYGAIGVNVWSGVLYSLPALTWGAFPGNPLTAIASGQGVVHNSSLFDYPQKSVLYAPFRIVPLPSWFPRHRNLKQLAQKFTTLQADPSWKTLAEVALAAIQG